MKPFARSITDLFDGKTRYVVPLFQRQYVWSREDQWEPLWEDIQRKYRDYVEKREGPAHFLGAMVIDQKRVFGNQVPAHLVIDGQQRLTTFQLFLAAFRDYCKDHGQVTYAEESNRYLANTGIMANKDEEKFKVWPTNLDRDQFAGVVGAQSREDVLRCFPQKWPKYARKPEPRPRMVECYLFFYDQIAAQMAEELGGLALETKVASLFETMQESLQVVTIELEGEDDPQVIFETLNARGEPLMPSDLLRNFIFWRAAQREEPQEDLYIQYWLPFDTDFWRTEEKQGRLKRPRLDLFLQHYLALKRQDDINIGHLFAEYKFWINRAKPFETVRAELAELVQHRDFFRSFLEPDTDTRLGRISDILKVLDTRTVYPLMLGILDRELSDDVLDGIFIDLESYIIRRAICGLTTKNYNRLFIGMLPRLPEFLDREGFRTVLLEMQGESSIWPDDQTFRAAWLQRPIYDILGGPKVRLILRALEDEMRSAKSEVVEVKSDLSVEHVLPAAWIENWPLPGGFAGIPFYKRTNGEVSAELVKASNYRDTVLHSIGNLTLLTQPLNSSLQNSAFEEKRPEILRSSALAMNRYFLDQETWDEEAILKRGEALYGLALQIWPHPGRT